MRYQFDITLTEEDYLLFNVFHSTETPHGKKEINKARIYLICIMVSLMVLFLLAVGITTFSIPFVLAIGIYTILHILLVKKTIKRNIAKHINKLKKTGKLPFDPISRYEFYDNTLKEITENKSSEESYCAIEKIYIIKDKLILIYVDSIRAYILPVPQIEKQANMEEFQHFLSQICSHIEYH